MRRYLHLLRIFWGNTLATELEYRTGFWANAALSFFWLVWAALGAGAYFRFAPSIRGWTYD
ncbi:MAG: ABC transporter permease, partial [bacterium]